MAAVDLARVRQPGHVEGSRAEEAVEAEFRQQADQQYGDSWTTATVQPGRVLPAAQEFTPESTLRPPQVRQDASAETCYQEI